MAQVNTSTLQANSWADGQTVTAAEMKQDTLTLATAQNDTDTQVQTLKTGGVTGTMIAAGAVGTTQLADGSVTTSKIATGALDGRYYTQTQLDGGQLDTRYYTQSTVDSKINNASYTKTVQAGTSFPSTGTFSEGQEFWRSDLAEMYVYHSGAWIAIVPSSVAVTNASQTFDGAQTFGTIVANAFYSGTPAFNMVPETGGVFTMSNAANNKTLLQVKDSDNSAHTLNNTLDDGAGAMSVVSLKVNGQQITGGSTPTTNPVIWVG